MQQRAICSTMVKIQQQKDEVTSLTSPTVSAGTDGRPCGSTEALDAVEQDPQDPARAPIFRPVQYLGNKLRAVDAIVSLAQQIAPDGGQAVDLFAGSSVISQGLVRAGYTTTAVDTQVYSTFFSRALLSVGRRNGEMVDPAPLLPKAERAIYWADWEAREDELAIRSDGLGLRQLNEELPLAWRRGRLEGDAEAPLTSFYAGNYFGVRQALDLDAIRAAIDGGREFEKGSWRHAAAMTALMHAASMAVHSAGKHFAQPLKSRPENATFLNSRLLTDRRISVPDAFASACAEINRTAPAQDGGHRAITCEAEAHLADSDTRYTLQYLDPPYTAQQYSRFYHVLETIAAGAVPLLPPNTKPTSGLYPPQRYKSAFSSRRRAPAALAQLLELAAQQNSAAIVSYSVSSRASDGNARMISFEELLSACGAAFGPNNVEVVDLEHRYRQFNSGDKANANRDDKEVLVLCKPA